MVQRAGLRAAVILWPWKIEDDVDRVDLPRKLATTVRGRRAVRPRLGTTLGGARNPVSFEAFRKAAGVIELPALKLPVRGSRAWVNSSSRAKVCSSFKRRRYELVVIVKWLLGWERPPQ